MPLIRQYAPGVSVPGDPGEAKAAAAAAAGYAVRKMNVGDVEQVSEVHVAVWQATYRGLLPDDYLGGLEPRDFADRWSSRLSDGTRNAADVVGLDPDGVIVALGSAGPPRDLDVPAQWELWALNVLSVAQGTGLADLMMQRLARARSCCLWVLNGNSRAMSFYRRYGFELDGHAKPHGTTGATEVRMVRS